MPNERVSSVRIAPDNATVLNNLGLLADLAGTWRGEGFNLIARPDFEGKANLYLQLNQTRESLQIDPIGSSIPNRGFGQNDIELFGLTYLQKISELFQGGAMHIEPGIWITQPSTTYPPETPPGAGEQIIARMGTIPHGNSLLAQGFAKPFTGPPTLSAGDRPVRGADPAFSKFPSFNSTPFATLPVAPPVFSAAGSSEAATAAANARPPFDEYNLLVLESAGNPRTPFATTLPALPANINGVPMQTIINDPVTLLQQVINQQVADGSTFEGTVLNIATQAKLTFEVKTNAKPADPKSNVDTFGAGGIENILFLEGGEPTGKVGPNANVATVYATFWIEKVTPKSGPQFMQLQYAQMVVLNFAVLGGLNPPPPQKPRFIVLGWPHISVATLTKAFA